MFERVSNSLISFTHRSLSLVTQSYLPFGDLLLTFGHGNLCQDYRRTLDLENAEVGIYMIPGLAKSINRSVLEGSVMRVGAIEAGCTKFVCGIGNEQGEIQDRLRQCRRNPK
jgi:hypothetical protein